MALRQAVGTYLKTRRFPVVSRYHRAIRQQAQDGAEATLTLILGARAMLANAPRKDDRISRWALALQVRAGYGKALVAIAAKNARIAWALLAKGEAFKLARSNTLTSGPSIKTARVDGDSVWTEWGVTW